jgi:cell division protein FtsI (penicillin-binding protein 3)
VKGVLDADGGVVARTPKTDLEILPQAIDPVTAAQVKRVLCDTVIRGSAQRGRSKTWNIFGKTGTAHISQGRSGYDQSSYHSSFIGGAPAENPQVVIAMVIHEPDKSRAHYGGTVSAPAACTALERIMAYQQVPASPNLPVPPPQIANVLYNFDPRLYTNRIATAGE